MRDVDHRTQQVADIIANTLTAWPEMTWEDVLAINASTGWTYVAHAYEGYSEPRSQCYSGLRLDTPDLRRAWDIARQLVADTVGDEDSFQDTY